jgi:hypothetical protein
MRALRQESRPPGVNNGTSGTIGNAPSVSNVQVTNVTISWNVVSGLETLNHDWILAHCNKVLRAYIVLRIMYLCNEMPLNANGRVF